MHNNTLFWCAQYMCMLVRVNGPIIDLTMRVQIFFATVHCTRELPVLGRVEYKKKRQSRRAKMKKVCNEFRRSEVAS